ncbi:MAG: hypothetical protein KTR31_26255 [Myxococcales bacterium]|nr:hypothetical protein [Myxococcales bacterium]
MSQHVPEDLLQSFVEGDVGEQLAIHIAEHIDECPSCATRATGMEPLAAAFAAMEDPVAPRELAHTVLAELRQPERVPVLEIGVGVGLLLCSAAMALALQSPLALAADFAVALNAVSALGRGLGATLGSLQTVLTVSTLLSAIGVAATVHFAGQPSAALLRRVR